MPLKIPTVQTGLEKSIKRAVRNVSSRGGLNLSINDRNFSRPLGKITGSVSEFNKSLEASNARVLAFGASVGIIQAVQKAFASLVTTTIQVEQKLTEINVVMGLTNSQLEDFGKSLFKVAKNTAQSFDTVATAATELARQGLGVEETLKRANDALILTRLTGLDAAAAVSGLTAALNTFNNVGLDSTQILSKMAAVDVQFAVSTEDLIDAVSRAGAVASDAGVSFDELLGAVTAAQQMTARGGKVIGNSFKTIFTRVQRSSTITRLEELGIAVRDISGNTLPAINVLQNLAKTYDKLADTTKAAVAEQVGGVFQINILKAAIKDLSSENSILSRATQISASATDEAYKKNEILNRSLAALSSQAATSLKELAGALGEIAFADQIRDYLTFIKDQVSGISDFLGQKQGESAGSDFAKGVIAGIGNVLTGPGLFLTLAVLSKLFVKTFSFLAGSGKELLGVVTAAEKQKQIQASIVTVLNENSALQKRILSQEGNRAAQEKTILNILQQQSREQAKIAAAARAMSPGISRAGFGGDLRRKSDGHIPNYVSSSERSSEKKGARQGGYTAGAVKSMNLKGEGRVIFNSAETVKKFSGLSQPAIMPPESSRAGRKYRKAFSNVHGMDPYANRGYVPNYNRARKISSYKPTPHNIASALVHGKRRALNLDTGGGRVLKDSWHSSKPALATSTELDSIRTLVYKKFLSKKDSTFIKQVEDSLAGFGNNVPSGWSRGSGYIDGMLFDLNMKRAQSRGLSSPHKLPPGRELGPERDPFMGGAMSHGHVPNYGLGNLFRRQKPKTSDRDFMGKGLGAAGKLISTPFKDIGSLIKGGYGAYMKGTDFLGKGILGAAKGGYNAYTNIFETGKHLLGKGFDFMKNFPRTTLYGGGGGAGFAFKDEIMNAIQKYGPKALEMGGKLGKGALDIFQNPTSHIDLISGVLGGIIPVSVLGSTLLDDILRMRKQEKSNKVGQELKNKGKTRTNLKVSDLPGDLQRIAIGRMKANPRYGNETSFVPKSILDELGMSDGFIPNMMFRPEQMVMHARNKMNPSQSRQASKLKSFILKRGALDSAAKPYETPGMSKLFDMKGNKIDSVRFGGDYRAAVVTKDGSTYMGRFHDDIRDELAKKKIDLKEAADLELTWSLKDLFNGGLIPNYALSNTPIGTEYLSGLQRAQPANYNEATIAKYETFKDPTKLNDLLASPQKTVEALKYLDNKGLSEVKKSMTANGLLGSQDWEMVKSGVGAPPKADVASVLRQASPRDILNYLTGNTDRIQGNVPGSFVRLMDHKERSQVVQDMVGRTSVSNTIKKQIGSIRKSKNRINNTQMEVLSRDVLKLGHDPERGIVKARPMAGVLAQLYRSGSGFTSKPGLTGPGYFGETSGRFRGSDASIAKQSEIQKRVEARHLESQAALNTQASASGSAQQGELSKILKNSPGAKNLINNRSFEDFEDNLKDDKKTIRQAEKMMAGRFQKSDDIDALMRERKERHKKLFGKNFTNLSKKSPITEKKNPKLNALPTLEELLSLNKNDGLPKKIQELPSIYKNYTLKDLLRMAKERFGGSPSISSTPTLKELLKLRKFRSFGKIPNFALRINASKIKSISKPKAKIHSDKFDGTIGMSELDKIITNGLFKSIKYQPKSGSAQDLTFTGARHGVHAHKKGASAPKGFSSWADFDKNSPLGKSRVVHAASAGKGAGGYRRLHLDKIQSVVSQGKHLKVDPDMASKGLIPNFARTPAKYKTKVRDDGSRDDTDGPPKQVFFESSVGGKNFATSHAIDIPDFKDPSKRALQVIMTSEANPSLRGRGYGKDLYEHMAQYSKKNGYTGLYGDMGTSISAMRVVDSIAKGKKFKVEKAEDLQFNKDIGEKDGMWAGENFTYKISNQGHVPNYAGLFSGGASKVLSKNPQYSGAVKDAVSREASFGLTPRVVQAPSLKSSTNPGLAVVNQEQEGGSLAKARILHGGLNPKQKSGVPNYASPVRSLTGADVMSMRQDTRQAIRQDGLKAMQDSFFKASSAIDKMTASTDRGRKFLAGLSKEYGKNANLIKEANIRQKAQTKGLSSKDGVERNQFARQMFRKDELKNIAASGGPLGGLAKNLMNAPGGKFEDALLFQQGVARKSGDTETLNALRKIDSSMERGARNAMSGPRESAKMIERALKQNSGEIRAREKFQGTGGFNKSTATKFFAQDFLRARDPNFSGGQREANSIMAMMGKTGQNEFKNYLQQQGVMSSNKALASAGLQSGQFRQLVGGQAGTSSLAANQFTKKLGQFQKALENGDKKTAKRLERSLNSGAIGIGKDTQSTKALQQLVQTSKDNAKNAIKSDNTKAAQTAARDRLRGGTGGGKLANLSSKIFGNQLTGSFMSGRSGAGIIGSGLGTGTARAAGRLSGGITRAAKNFGTQGLGKFGGTMGLGMSFIAPMIAGMVSNKQDRAERATFNKTTGSFDVNDRGGDIASSVLMGAGMGALLDRKSVV